MAKRKLTKRSPRKRGRKTVSKKVSRKRAPRKNAHFRARSKRTFQLTDDLAKEVHREFVTKGRKPRLSAENARVVLYRALKNARKVFSRKKSSRWAVYLYIKWKHEVEGWVIRTVVRVAATPEYAIENLAHDIQDGALDTPASGVENAEEKIVGVKIEKYVTRHRKISKAPKGKRKNKRTRRIRHRK